MKIRPVGAELSREDGRTKLTKLIVAFRNFANAPKSCRFAELYTVSNLGLSYPGNGVG